jgi:anti-sigma factor RsiW
MMNGDRELIHRLVDGDVTEAEKEASVKRILADPALQEEYLELTAALQIVEERGRMDAPPAFTARVMQRLPRRRAMIGARLKEFFFGARVLRWNMAAAGVAILLAAGVVAALLTFRGDAPTAGAGPGGEAQTVIVRLELDAPAARRVAVAGSFNRWDGSSHQLSRDDQGRWSIALPMRPGVYAYTFIIDGTEWIADPKAPAVRDDGFGNRNSVMRVGI